MDKPAAIRLDLRAPLLYGNDPVLAASVRNGMTEENAASSGGERLFCFEVDPEQGRCIEPDRKRFLGALIFAGRVTGGAARVAVEQPPADILLPAGLYLFAQSRTVLGRKEWLDLAIEQQKDGLWERLIPESRLYVRYLYEDEKPVTQIFRPYSRSVSTI